MSLHSAEYFYNDKTKELTECNSVSHTEYEPKGYDKMQVVTMTEFNTGTAFELRGILTTDDGKCGLIANMPYDLYFEGKTFFVTNIVHPVTFK